MNPLHDRIRIEFAKKNLPEDILTDFYGLADVHPDEIEYGTPSCVEVARQLKHLEKETERFLAALYSTSGRALGNVELERPWPDPNLITKPNGERFNFFDFANMVPSFLDAVKKAREKIGPVNSTVDSEQRNRVADLTAYHLAFGHGFALSDSRAGIFVTVLSIMLQVLELGGDARYEARKWLSKPNNQSELKVWSDPGLRSWARKPH